MFARQAGYLRTVQEQGFRLAGGYVDHDEAFHRVGPRCAVRAARRCRATTTCWPATSSTTATKVWLIDYEYSGNNDACFELGNTGTECDLDDDQVEALVAAYVGATTRATLARARLQALVSAYGWSLWGAIQAARQHHRLRLRRVGTRTVREGRAGVHLRAASRRLLEDVDP